MSYAARQAARILGQAAPPMPPAGGDTHDDESVEVTYLPSSDSFDGRIREEWIVTVLPPPGWRERAWANETVDPADLQIQSVHDMGSGAPVPESEWRFIDTEKLGAAFDDAVSESVSSCGRCGREYRGPDCPKCHP